MKNCLNGPPRATRFTKSRRGPVPPERTIPPSTVGGPGPVRWWDQAPASTRGDPMYTIDPGTQDGVSIWHRRQSLAPEGTGRCDGVEPGHTPRPRVGRRVRMLLSFQRPSHLFGRGFLPRALPKSSPIPERIGEYSAQTAARTILARRRIVATVQPRTVALVLSADWGETFSGWAAGPAGTTGRRRDDAWSRADHR